MRAEFLRAFSGTISLLLGFAELRRAISFFRCRIQVRAQRSKRFDIMYPLANDENGYALEVPSTATGWLIKRHAGQKGRPGVIFDTEGRPLVVPLDATLTDLRAQSCGPGAYRLEALDASRKPLGVVGYMEIPESPSDAAAPLPPPISGEQAAWAAMSRTVEAMQRVQAERERTQAEMFAKLIERLSPPPVNPALDLRDALQHVVELHKTVRDMVEPEEAMIPATPAPAPVVVERKEEWSEVLLKQAVIPHLPGIAKWIWKQIGLTTEQQTELGQHMHGSSPAAPPPSSPPGSDPPPAPAPPSGNGAPPAAGGTAPSPSAAGGSPPSSANRAAPSAGASAVAPEQEQEDPDSATPSGLSPEQHAKLVAMLQVLRGQGEYEAVMAKMEAIDPAETAGLLERALVLSVAEGAAVLRSVILPNVAALRAAPPGSPPPSAST